MESNSFFSTAKPLRLFFRVALPGMVSMLAMSLYSVIEGSFIGRLLGETAFAAVNIAMPFVMINFSLADLVGVGSSVQISIALGAKDHEKANLYFTCSILLIFLCSALMGLILYFGSPALVAFMGAEGQLAEVSVRYVRVFALLGPFSTIIFAMDNYLRICGYVRGSMLLNIFMSCLTVTLLYIFIVKFGMHVEGSALGSALSMFVCAVIALTPFVRKKALLCFVKPQITGKMIRQIVACGMPVFLNNISGRVAAILMTMALLKLGGQTAVAAYSVIMYASDVIQPMLYGMTDSVQPAVGYNWGARDIRRVRDIYKCSFTACAVVSVVGTLVMYFLPEPLCRLFVAEGDQALLEMSIRAMRLFSFAYLVRWFGFALQGFFSAIEKPVPATILSVASAMVFPIVLIAALWPLGLDGLWLNMAGTSLLVAILAYFQLRRIQKEIAREFTL